MALQHRFLIQQHQFQQEPRPSCYTGLGAWDAGPSLRNLLSDAVQPGERRHHSGASSSTRVAATPECSGKQRNTPQTWMGSHEWHQNKRQAADHTLEGCGVDRRVRLQRERCPSRQHQTKSKNKPRQGPPPTPLRCCCCVCASVQPAPRVCVETTAALATRTRLEYQHKVLPLLT
jgi:hypothetical protein